MIIMGQWQEEVKKVREINTTKKTVTAIMLPGKAGYGNKAIEKTWKNYCPLCGKSGTLTFNPKKTQTGEWTCDKSKGGCDADYCGVSGKDKAVRSRATLTPATADVTNSQSSNSSESSNSSNSSSGSSSNPMLSGEKSFKDIIGDLCNAFDIMFLCKRNQIVITDFESIYAEADLYRQKIPDLTEDIQLWQLQDGTYDHDVKEYGFFTVVYVHYNKGICKEYVPDLVNVYGEIPKHYYEKDLSRTQAEVKAKTYLAAHMRDFEMGIKASVLYNGGLDIGDIVTIENPLTLQNEIKKLDIHTENYYFLKGINLDWDEESALKADIELSYAPAPPERGASDLLKYGSNGGESNVTGNSQFKGGEGATVDAVVKKICANTTNDLDKAKKIHNWLTSHIRYSGYSCSHHSTAEACMQSKYLNCADTSRLTRAMMSSAGLDAEVVHGPDHFWTIVTIGGQEYASDATSRLRPFNQVMRNLKYTSKCGDNPSC